MSKAAYLAKKYGGKWTYDGHTTWWCDDDNRSVARTSSGLDEFDNPYGPPVYYLHDKNAPTTIVNWR